MKGKKMTAVIFAALLLCGCKAESNPPDEQPASVSAEYETDEISVAEIKAKYSTDKSEESVIPIYNVAPNEKFEFRFKCTTLSDYNGSNDYITVHTDKKCLPESMIYTYTNFDEPADGGTIVTVSPISPILETETDEQRYLDEDYEAWGNAAVYYIAIWYDMDSEEIVKLDKPKVIPFTVKHDVQAPEAKAVVDNTGRFSIQWEAVEGAEKYNVYTLTNGYMNTGKSNPPLEAAENGYKNCSMLLLGTTTDTRYADFDGSGDNIVVFERSVTGKEYIIGQNFCVNSEYYVSAVKDGKESGFARAVTTSELKIPYKLTEESDIMFRDYTDVSQLPKTLDVINIDGSITKRNVMYTFQMHDTYLEGVQVPEYAYAVEGTAITGCVSMVVDDPNYDFPETIGEITYAGYSEPINNIDAVPDASVENAAKQLADGETLAQRQIEETKSIKERGNADKTEMPTRQLSVFADSAEEEWIALNLINGEEKISMDAFPEMQIYDNLEDVLNKVYYQNPYVLGVYQYSYNYFTKDIEVSYNYTQDEIEAHQKAMSDEADNIIAEIITNDMTNTEKQLALYQYLENNSVYDYDALESAKKNNYKKISDASFEDSFNAYGVLVNKKGVCMSYAAAYKLLCDKCGIDCNVVTGYLNGNLPHAWNNVDIDGNWYQTDVTNNGTSMGVPYYLYNSDTHTAEETGYTEDTLYDIDGETEKFFCDVKDYEYYYSNKLCASTCDELKSVISNELDKGKDFICIRYTGTLPAQEELVKTVKEAYYAKNRESELSTLKMGIKKNFIILSK